MFFLLILTLELQIWRLSMQEDHLDVDIFAILMKEILQKMAYRLVGYVAADDNMPRERERAREMDHGGWIH